MQHCIDSTDSCTDSLSGPVAGLASGASSAASSARLDAIADPRFIEPCAQPVAFRLHDYHAMNASASRIARSAARQPRHRGTTWSDPTWPLPPSAAGTCRGPGRSPTPVFRAANGLPDGRRQPVAGGRRHAVDAGQAGAVSAETGFVNGSGRPSRLGARSIRGQLTWPSQSASAWPPTPASMPPASIRRGSVRPVAPGFGGHGLRGQDAVW